MTGFLQKAKNWIRRYFDKAKAGCNGGAIYSSGTLAVIKSTFSGNGQ